MVAPYSNVTEVGQRSAQTVTQVSRGQGGCSLALNTVASQCSHSLLRYTKHTCTSTLKLYVYEKSLLGQTKIWGMTLCCILNVSDACPCKTHHCDARVVAKVLLCSFYLCQEVISIPLRILSSMYEFNTQPLLST